MTNLLLKEYSQRVLKEYSKSTTNYDLILFVPYLRGLDCAHCFLIEMFYGSSNGRSSRGENTEQWCSTIFKHIIYRGSKYLCLIITLLLLNMKFSSIAFSKNMFLLPSSYSYRLASTA